MTRTHLLSVTVPSPWKHALERHAHQNERTLSSEARLALGRHLEQMNAVQSQRALSQPSKEAT